MKIIHIAVLFYASAFLKALCRNGVGGTLYLKAVKGVL